MHGGALVANYPFDNSAKTLGVSRRKRSQIISRQRRNTYSPSVSDDDDVFRYLAKAYARHHVTIQEGNSCKSDRPGIAEFGDEAWQQYGAESFPGGIVNGNQWYPVAGGMQDWNYLHTNCLEITVEIGCIKFPSEKYWPEYWKVRELILMITCSRK